MLDQIHALILSIWPLRAGSGPIVFAPLASKNAQKLAGTAVWGMRVEGAASLSASVQADVKAGKTAAIAQAKAKEDFLRPFDSLPPDTLLALFWLRSAAAIVAASKVQDLPAFKTYITESQGAEDWSKAGQAVLETAALGAALGTKVPVIGNVIGAVGGAIAGAFRALFEWADRESDRRKARTFAWIALGAVIDRVGPPPVGAGLILGGHAKADPFGKVDAIMRLAARAADQYPAAWKVAPLPTAEYFADKAIPALYSAEDRTYAYPLLAPSTYRVTQNWQLHEAKGWLGAGFDAPFDLAGKKYTAEDQSLLVASAMLHLDLASFLPELYPAAAKGFLTPAEAASLGGAVSRNYLGRENVGGRLVLASNAPNNWRWLQSIVLELNKAVVK